MDVDAPDSALDELPVDDIKVVEGEDPDGFDKIVDERLGRSDEGVPEPKGLLKIVLKAVKRLMLEHATSPILT